MAENVVAAQNNVLKALSGKINDFYLAGGTALSLFYFNHRQSEDLDFFTQELNPARVRGIVERLHSDTKKEIKLIGENLSHKNAEVMIYALSFAKNRSLKIDFVRDFLPLVKKVKLVEGIPVLSLEDIYLRKIYAVAGAFSRADDTGRKEIIGGRQEAKDIFDIYFLSHTFLALSDFVNRHCDQVRKEGLIRWFRTFDRMQIKIDLKDIRTDKKVDFKDMDRHIAREIDKILKREIEL